MLIHTYIYIITRLFNDTHTLSISIICFFVVLTSVDYNESVQLVVHRLHPVPKVVKVQSVGFIPATNLPTAPAFVLVPGVFRAGQHSWRQPSKLAAWVTGRRRGLPVQPCQLQWGGAQGGKRRSHEAAVVVSGSSCCLPHQPRGSSREGCLATQREEARTAPVVVGGLCCPHSSRGHTHNWGADCVQGQWWGVLGTHEI